jgi:hypothetical protein
VTGDLFDDVETMPRGVSLQNLMRSRRDPYHPMMCANSRMGKIRFQSSFKSTTVHLLNVAASRDVVDPGKQAEP